MLAEYLTECLGARAAVFEMNRHGHMEMLEQEIYGTSGGKFSFRGVDCHKGGERMEEAFRKDARYDYEILDFGSGQRGREQIWQACEERALIGTLSLWEGQEYRMAARSIGKEMAEGSLRYAVSLGDEKAVRRLERELGQKVCLLGYQPFGKPFTREAERFFRLLA